MGLAILAGPIISLIYEHGRFGAGDTSGTAAALIFYALGLYAYSGVKVFAPAFYALDEARVPVAGSVLGMAANVALNLVLYPALGYRGVALGTSLAAWANFAVLAIAWRRRHGGLGGERVYRQLGRVLVASAVLALVCWGAAGWLAPRLPGHGLARQIPQALFPIAAGAAVYFAVARLLGVRELSEVVSALRRRRPPADR
jgi:putative peptidoglycan lipid II flippase